MVKLIRNILGKLILALNALFPPRSMNRAAEKQKEVDEQTRALALYQFEACPFCVKVRRAIKHLNLNIEIRDILKNKEYEAELIQGGGKRKVPCLRITEETGARWMYESSDINDYLQKRFQ